MRRSAFTLVELLVAVAIIGILMALLLPAVQFARETARRMTCANNLRQLAAGAHLHHDTFRVLPHAGYHWRTAPMYENGVPLIKERQLAGWGFQILPFIEQMPLHAGHGQTDDLEKSVQAISTPVATFFCPTRRMPRANQAATINYGPSGWSGSQYCWGTSGRTYRHAGTDYCSTYVNPNWGADAAGIDVQAHPQFYVPTDDGYVYRSGALPRVILDTSPKTNPPRVRDGMFGFESISDGTTNVILFGEKRMSLSRIGDSVPQDDQGYTAGWDQDILANATNHPLPDQRHGSLPTNDLRFGSSHPGGFNVALCDGSVRLVIYEIDQLTIHRYGYRNDGGLANLDGK